MINNPSFWKKTIFIAGIFNIIFGLFYGFNPNLIFKLAEMPSINYPLIWQGASVMLIVYGIGYLIASTNPIRYWPIVFIGFIIKLTATIAFIYYTINEKITWKLDVILITNNIIWIVPFALFLKAVYDDYIDESEEIILNRPLEQNLKLFTNQHDNSIYELSFEKPQLLIFLRHLGCNFCKEALSDLSEQKAKIEQLGINITLVFMSENKQINELLSQYNLQSVDRISDENCELYRSFGLKRAKLNQLFGIKAWLRTLKIALLNGQMLGLIEGDAFRMPGTFIIHKGKVICGYNYKSVSDRPHYHTFAKASTVSNFEVNSNAN